MITIVNELLNKFKITVNQIKRNSDNNIDDIRNESFIIVYENLDKITDNQKIFINMLKSNCLKFNKYNRRIESHDRWERFNNYEDKLKNEYKNDLEVNEDFICIRNDIINNLGKDNYNFLIYYYSYGGKETSIKYNIKEDLVRKRISNLIKQIRKIYGIGE